MTDRQDLATSIVRRLREAGHVAYFAGGCVRDRLLGRTPDDYDVATSAPPEAVRALFPRTVPVGMQFGVVLVLGGDERVEVATFRADGAYVDGRRPSAVHFGSVEDDAQRRDFTINAMYWDPVDDTIIDLVNGQDDLRAGIIRAIGDPQARIAEDRLRMLRAVRLAARFGFRIDPATLDAIVAAAPTVTDMAAERIGDEIVKILTEGRARRGFELLAETRLLDVVLPEVAAMRGVAQPPDFHPEGDVWVHTLLLLEQLPAPVSESLALGALLHDVAKPPCAEVRGGRITFWQHDVKGEDMAVAICQRLRRSRETWERVGYLVRHHLRLGEAPAMRLATLKRLLANPGFDDLLALARLDAMASNRDLRAVEFCERTHREFRETVRPPRLVDGADLLALGYPRGPLIGRILHAVEDAQLDGEITTRDDALVWVRARFPA